MHPLSHHSSFMHFHSNNSFFKVCSIKKWLQVEVEKKGVLSPLSRVCLQVRYYNHKQLYFSETDKQWRETAYDLDFKFSPDDQSHNEGMYM